MSFKPADWPRKLRSQVWYGGDSRDNIYHRSWMKNQGQINLAMLAYFTPM